MRHTCVMGIQLGVVVAGASLLQFACTATTTVELLPSRGEGNGGPTTGGASAGGTASTAGGGSTTGSVTSSAGGTSPVGSTTSNAFGTAGASGLPPELIHLWDFAGTGTGVLDRVTSVKSNIIGGSTLDGNGHLRIVDNVSYVDLPAWLISRARSNSLTVATWITWFGGGSWQRVFDFGATEAGDGVPGTAAVAQFYFTPRFEPRQFYSALLDSDFATADQATVEGLEPFPIDMQTFVAVVVDGDETAGTSTLRVYLNGTLVGTPTTTRLRLSEFKDQNCWLGQSQWIQDALHFNGEYDEFRIYSRALSAGEIEGLSLSDPARL